MAASKWNRHDPQSRSHQPCWRRNVQEWLAPTVSWNCPESGPHQGLQPAVKKLLVNMKRRALLLSTLGAALAGCDVFPEIPLPEAQQPRFAPWTEPARLALVLSSGGPRGFSHVGALKALHEIGVRPDLVVGASVGALLGSLLCAGVPMAEIEQLGLDFDFRSLVRLSLTSGYKLSGSGIAQFVNQEITRRLGHSALERLPVRFAAIAAEAHSGELAAFNHGDAGRAVQASAAIPGRFDPVLIRGRLYADADLHAPMPVRWTRSAGAKKIIALDCSARTDNLPPGSGSYREADLKKRALSDAEAKFADITLHPDIGYWVRLTREYRVSTARAAYEYTMARRREIEKVAAG